MHIAGQVDYFPLTVTSIRMCLAASNSKRRVI